jgi:agmatinase
MSSLFEQGVALKCGTVDLKKAKYCLIGFGFDGNTIVEKGSAKAPNELRKRFEKLSVFDLRTKKNLYEQFFDAGNLKLKGKEFKQFTGLTKKALKEIFKENKKVVPVFLGGDHSITYITTKALRDLGKRFELIQFDAHPDCWRAYSEEIFQGDIVPAILEEKIALRAVQVGVRDVEEDEWSYLKKNKKVKTFYMEKIKRKGIKWLKKELKKETKNKNLYITFDVDVLDPAYAIGTGYPSANGFTPEEAKELLRALDSKKIIGMDLVEVNPALDKSGITAFTAADLLKEMVLL